MLEEGRVYPGEKGMGKITSARSFRWAVCPRSASSTADKKKGRARVLPEDTDCTQKVSMTDYLTADSGKIDVGKKPNGDPA